MPMDKAADIVLPVELFGYISRYLTGSDLCSAAVVCAAIQREAERILYDTVHAERIRTYTLLQSFLALLVGHPRRAQYVRDLTLPAALGLDWFITGRVVDGKNTYSPDDHRNLLDTVTRAISSTRNLRRLHLPHPFSPSHFHEDQGWRAMHTSWDQSAENNYVTCVLVRTLMGAPLGLQALHDGPWPFGQVEHAFYSTHTEITDWSLRPGEIHEDSGAWPLPGDVLPRLNVVDTRGRHPVLQCLEGRPLERVAFGPPEHIRGSSAKVIHLFSSSLRHICATYPGDGIIVDALQALAASNPATLVSMTIISTLDLGLTMSTTMLRVVSAFSNLEILIVEGDNRPLTNNAACHEIAEDAQAASSSLQRAALRRSPDYAWTCFALADRESGSVTLEGYDLLDGSSWRSLP